MLNLYCLVSRVQCKCNYLQYHLHTFFFFFRKNDEVPELVDAEVVLVPAKQGENARRDENGGPRV